MTKTGKNKILYWIATLWLALGMVSTGIVQLLNTDQEAATINRLGYPFYVLTLLGSWKIAGAIAVLLPGLLLLKEWAYAGFFFLMSGAIISHIAIHDPLSTLFPPLLLLALTMASWYFRPANRKIISVTQ